MTGNAVEVKNLTKKYGKFNAVDNITLGLEENKIYGLLGRNGAGKTTLLNMITSRIFASSGNINVFGSEPFENKDVLEKICFIEEKGFYDPATRIKYILAFMADLYPNWDKEFAAELLVKFELNENKKYKQLSRGMESSLGLIIGLASRAPLTIFDEPSLGLDAVIRERFYDILITDFAENPRTIIISTHLIDEISRIFEDVVIIDTGRILLKSNAAELKEKAFFVSGKEEDVKKVCSGLTVLHEESFGGTSIFAVYTAKRPQPAAGIDIQPIPMQKLFVYLINPDIQKKIREGGVI